MGKNGKVWGNGGEGVKVGGSEWEKMNKMDLGGNRKNLDWKEFFKKF